eukprot:s75_g5.t1
MVTMTNAFALPASAGCTCIVSGLADMFARHVSGPNDQSLCMREPVWAAVADLHVLPTCCLETLEVTMINAFARQARVGRVCIAPDWQVCLETLEVTMINAFARQARVGRVCIAPDWQVSPKAHQARSGSP